MLENSESFMYQVKRWQLIMKRHEKTYRFDAPVLRNLES